VAVPVSVAPTAKGKTVTTRPLKFLEADYNRLMAAARRRHLPVEQMIGEICIGQSTRGSIDKSLSRFGDFTGDVKCGGEAERATDDEALWSGLIAIEKEIDRLIALFSAPTEEDEEAEEAE
jgi:hypothetical protein